MTQITISNGTTSVTMPRTKKVEVGGKEVGKSRTMASGRVIKRIIGTRATVVAKWDAIPAETITSLLLLLKSGGFFSVSYPSPSGDSAGTFSIGYPTLGIFGFINGAPVWHDVTLRMEAQEVS